MMNSVEMAEAYLREAKVRLEAAKMALTEWREYAFCIRMSQEAVELSIKACLRLAGIEYPKTHDPGRLLISYADRFPEWFRAEIEYMAEISRWLSAERGPAMYGDEAEGAPPTALYTEGYARKALEAAMRIYELAVKYIGEVAR